MDFSRRPSEGCAQLKWRKTAARLRPRVVFSYVSTNSPTRRTMRTLSHRGHAIGGTGSPFMGFVLVARGRGRDSRRRESSRNMDIARDGIERPYVERIDPRRPRSTSCASSMPSFPSYRSEEHTSELQSPKDLVC